MRVRSLAAACGLVVICGAISAAALAPGASAAVTPAPASCVQAHQLGVVVVLDDSGSMATSDPHRLRTEASVIALAQQGTGGVYALSTFSDAVHDIVAPTVLTGSNRSGLATTIRARAIDYMGTNYDVGFVEAKRQLDAMPSSVDKRAVIFVSDGQPNFPFASDAPIAAAGVPIYTVGFGGVDQSQLAGISARSGGQTFPITHAGELQPVLAKILAVLECDAQNIVDRISLAPGESRSIPFTVAPTEDEFKALAAWSSGSVTVTLTRPDGTTMDAAQLRGGERWDGSPTFASAVGVDPLRGRWTVNLTASAMNVATVDVTINVWGGRRAAPDPAPPVTPTPPPVVPTPPVTPVPPATHPAPASCSGVAVTRGTQSSVTLSWARVAAQNPKLSAYYIEYRTAGTPVGAWKRLPATIGQSITVIGPAPGSTFEYSIRSVFTDQALSDRCIVAVTAPIFSTLVGTNSSNRLAGTAGRDKIAGRGGNDSLLGTSGSDVLDGGPGNDTLDGGTGDDTIIGGPGADIISGGPGADAIDVRDGSGTDAVRCGAGKDVVQADRADRIAADCETVTRTK